MSSLTTKPVRSADRAATIAIDPVLRTFQLALREVYGDTIERIVLYGSRARGDAGPDSDYDVAVFLKKFTSATEEFKRLTHAEVAALDATGGTVHALPFRAGVWRNSSSPLMFEIRKDGLDL